ncbi:MAG TPA: hypothetical protein VGG75_06300 [Trebonia sp.]|jgi:hypothetical protein
MSYVNDTSIFRLAMDALQFRIEQALQHDGEERAALLDIEREWVKQMRERYGAEVATSWFDVNDVLGTAYGIAAASVLTLTKAP